MKPFASLDEVLNSRALTPAQPRNSAAPAGDFKPLFSEKALSAASEDRMGEHAHEAPQIELVETDGRVQQIIVTCGCGERTVLDCAY